MSGHRIDADWLRGRPARTVCAVLEGAGHRALFVGGCVRNALLGAPVTDLDLASDARPERTTALMEAAGVKVVATGLEHGTVTAVVDHVPIEITTFRRDVETHGRHATVAFSDDPAEDAARRDFTMNALYCDIRGTLVDPLGGLPDLVARRLRFVGRAEDRVQEDYLRILRFFRFHAWYADSALGIDAEGLAACAAHAGGLRRISAERIGAETKKLLAAPDPAPEVAAMQRTGVLAVILPGADSAALAPLVHLEAPGVPDPILRLAALGGEDVADRLRLSRAEGRRRDALIAAACGTADPAELGWRLGAGDGQAALVLRAALTGQPPRTDAAAEVARGAAAIFPVSAADLAPELQGPALGQRLKALEAKWIASGLTATRDDLLA